MVTALGLLLVGGGMARAAGATLTVSLSPTSIAADGVSHSMVTVTLSPLRHAQWIVLSAPFDPRISFGTVHDNGDGTYTSTLTSSRSAEVTQIFAANQTGSDEVFPATLTQLGASATSVTAVTGRPVTSSNAPVTNEGVVLLATVAPLTDNLVSPSGTVSFENGGSPIAGCRSLPIESQLTGTASVNCNTWFAAAASPADVSAVFSPAAGSLVGGSSSLADGFPVDRDSTSTSVTAASPPAVGSPVRYVATVTPGHTGALSPTGFVRFSDNGTTIGSCSQQQLDASATATCTVTYRASGTHAIAASYGGDGNFSASYSSAVRESAQPVGTIDASMQWRFLYTDRYTQALQLIVNRAPLGSRVSISCHGRGCRFEDHTIDVRTGRHCGGTASGGCATSRTVDLTPQIRQTHLPAHTRLRIAITKSGWTGKAYSFTIRAGLPPAVQINPVPPGGGES
jgi:Bacterial Ig-like domain (group 3)/Invasin, domain 3